MSRKHLLPPGNEEYLDRMGLTRQDKSVFISTLDSGLVSVGEIVQLTKLTLDKVLESIRDLVDIGLIKKAVGRMPRYYSVLPFFRETISIEKETIFSLDAMINSLHQNKNELTQQREKLKNVDFKNYQQKYLDAVYKEIIQPFLKLLEDLKNQVETSQSGFMKNIEKDNAHLISKIIEVLNPLKAFAKLQGQKFDVALMKEVNLLEEFITERKTSRIQILKTSQSQLKQCLDNINNGKTDFLNLVKQQLNQIGLIISSSKKFENLVSEVEDTLTDLQKDFDIPDESAKSIKIRNTFRDELRQQLDNTNIENFDEIFSNSFNKYTNALNNQNLQAIISKRKEISQLKQHIKKGNDLITVTIDNFNNNFKGLNESFSKNIQEVEKLYSKVLNEINLQDDQALQNLQIGLTDQIKNIENSIKQQGSELANKIDKKRDKIKDELTEVFSKWQGGLINLFNQPIENITPFLNEWTTKIKPIVTTFKDQTIEFSDQVLNPLFNLENESFGSLIKRIQFIKAMIEGRTKDLQSIMEFSRKFDYTRVSDTWVVVGLPSIYASLTDLLLRTKVKVTVVTPKLDLELIETARNMRSTIRITFVADIEKERDKRLLKKIDEVGRIHLRAFKDRNLYACVRDDEEIIFGYEQEGEEMIGIRSSTPTIINLLVDRLNETVIRNSKSLN